MMYNLYKFLCESKNILNTIKHRIKIKNVNILKSFLYDNIVSAAENTLINEETPKYVESRYLLSYIKKNVPTIEVDKTTNTIWVFPLQVDDFSDHPRKAKLVPKEWYWKYKITVNSDSIDLGVYGGGYDSMYYTNISKPILDFIGQSPLKINKLYFFTTGYYKNPVFKLIDNATRGCIFMSGFMPYKRSNTSFHKAEIPSQCFITDDMVKNFPSEILPKFDNGDTYDIKDKKSNTVLYKGLFTSNDKFLKVVLVLVNADYIIRDEDGYTYNSENINEYLNGTIVSQTAAANEDPEKQQWVINKIGQEYIDKFNIIKDVLMDKTEKRYFPLKKFNRVFRDNLYRLTHDMVKELIDANIDIVSYWNDNINKMEKDFINSTSNISNYDTLTDDNLLENLKYKNIISAFKLWDKNDILDLGARISLYKMANLTVKDNPNGWKNENTEFPDIYNFLTGKEFHGIMGNPANYSNIDLSLNTTDDLYYLFYVTAVGVMNLNSFLPEKFEDTKDPIYDCFEHIENATTNINMDTFDFLPMIKVFKRMIDAMYTKKVPKRKLTI